MENLVRDIMQGRTNDVTVAVHQCTPVATAAAHKHVCIEKHSFVKATLSNNPSAYTVAVRNDSGNEQFVARAATFTRDAECPALVTSAKGNVQLCYIAQGSLGPSYYTIDGRVASKQEVAELLTPSAAKALLNPLAAVHNKEQDTTHNVHIRTVNIANIVSIEVLE